MCLSVCGHPCESSEQRPISHGTDNPEKGFLVGVKDLSKVRAFGSHEPFYPNEIYPRLRAPPTPSSHICMHPKALRRRAPGARGRQLFLPSNAVRLPGQAPEKQGEYLVPKTRKEGKHTHPTTRSIVGVGWDVPQPSPHPPAFRIQDTPEGAAALADLLARVKGSKAWLEAVGYSEMAIETFWEVFVEELKELPSKTPEELDEQFNEEVGGCRLGCVCLVWGGWINKQATRLAG